MVIVFTFLPGVDADKAYERLKTQLDALNGISTRCRLIGNSAPNERCFSLSGESLPDWARTILEESGEVDMNSLRRWAP